MTDGPTTTREQELRDEFKAGLDPKDVPQLATRIATLEEEFAAANARADRAEKASTAAAAKAKAKVSRGDPSPRARALKPMGDDALGKDGVSAAIDDAIEAGKPVEIAFSDGKRELTQIPPVNVEGMAWREHSLGRMLGEPVTIKGVGNTSIGIHGYALLIGGKQVAYQTRSDPINVAPGQSLTLDNDIFF